MTAFNKEPAHVVAGLLVTVDQFPHATGLLSMLDEATLRWPCQEQRAFSEARFAHLRSYRDGKYSDEAWQRALAAARALAVVLAGAR